MRAVEISWMSPAPLMAALVVGGLVTQAYLAGLGVFGTPGGWALHGMFGGGLSIPIIELAAYSWFGAAGRPYRLPSSLLLVLYLLQIVLVVAGMETGAAWLAAFHPANALVMLMAALDVLRRGRAGRQLAEI